MLIGLLQNENFNLSGIYVDFWYFKAPDSYILYLGPHKANVTLLLMFQLLAVYYWTHLLHLFQSSTAWTFLVVVTYTPILAHILAHI